ncbi:hypothetical protein EDB81DRAFT_438043 [Dactylonectria macrodidyma]|uniref:Uncharacterized protein n=1 Tax=Dactylonectria macrodidyma TaxID=307937 RepID=A0A9P9F650_9HYPO|nr:hypothetical protein EDB81DRAFT_438043 [Dactylonectria macrodidyma]
MQRSSRHGQCERKPRSLAVTHGHCLSPTRPSPSLESLPHFVGTHVASLGRRSPRHLHDGPTPRHLAGDAGNAQAPTPSASSVTMVAPTASSTHTRAGEETEVFWKSRAQRLTTAAWPWSAASALECSPPRQMPLLARRPGLVSSLHDWCFSRVWWLRTFHLLLRATLVACSHMPTPGSSLLSGRLGAAIGHGSWCWPLLFPPRAFS